jgi:hypothetical protein
LFLINIANSGLIFFIQTQELHILAASQLRYLHILAVTLTLLIQYSLFIFLEDATLLPFIAARRRHPLSVRPIARCRFSFSTKLKIEGRLKLKENVWWY